jgi:hypothetical protein
MVIKKRNIEKYLLWPISTKIFIIFRKYLALFSKEKKWIGKSLFLKFNHINRVIIFTVKTNETKIPA